MTKLSKPTRLTSRLWVFSCLLLISACQQQTHQPSPPQRVTIPSPTPKISPVSSEDSGYLGLSPTEAKAKATRAGLRSRVISIDGKSGRVTKDYRPTRLNFAVNDGKVTRITKG